MSERNLIYLARTISLLITPFYLPLVGLVALFMFSYMSQLPLWYKTFVLLLVYFFTILLPTLVIRIYRTYNGWSPVELGLRERRMVPYIISIASYFACYYIMAALRMPTFMARILVAALLIQILCAIVNVWWKISTHTAAIGGVAGALLAFASVFSFNPLGWLSFVLLVAGLVGTSRMILRQHTLSQVLAGFFVGFLCAHFSIVF